MTKEVMTTIMRRVVLPTDVAVLMLTWKVKALIVLLGSPSQPSLQQVYHHLRLLYCLVWSGLENNHIFLPVELFHIQPVLRVFHLL